MKRMPRSPSAIIRAAMTKERVRSALIEPMIRRSRLAIGIAAGFGAAVILIAGASVRSVNAKSGDELFGIDHFSTAPSQRPSPLARPRERGLRGRPAGAANQPLEEAACSPFDSVQFALVCERSGANALVVSGRVPAVFLPVIDRQMHRLAGKGTSACCAIELAVEANGQGVDAVIGAGGRARLVVGGRALMIGDAIIGDVVLTSLRADEATFETGDGEAFTVALANKT